MAEDEVTNEDIENLQQMQQQTQKQPPKYLYVYYEPKNRYYFQGGFLESTYGVGSVIVSDYPNEEETLNRNLMIEGVGEGIKKVGEYVEEHYGENIREGLKVTPQAKKEFKEAFKKPLERQYQKTQQQRQREDIDPRPKRQRSPFYQEESVFGKSCVPYRPIGKDVFLKHTPVGRPVRTPLFKPIPISFMPVQHENKGYYQGGNRGAGFVPHFATFKFVGRRANER